MQTKPTYESSYRGETDYRIGQQSYSVRFFAENDGHWTAWDEIRACVGTVMNKYKVREFPPADVMAMFPGYVAARWSSEDKAIVYQDKPPVVVVDGNTLWAQAHVDEMRRVIPDWHTLDLAVR